MRLHSTPTLPVRMVALAVLLWAGSPALQAQTNLSLTLRGAAEVPPSNTAATGSGEIKVAPDHTVAGSITVSGMTPTMAHIHMGGAGKAGPVIIPLTKTAADTFAVPPGAKLTDAQYAAFLKGDLYVNVHSAAHPAGEVRAQLTPVTATSRSSSMPGY